MKQSLPLYSLLVKADYDGFENEETMKNYIDCHIHIEKGAYTLEWVDRFVEKASERDMNEIWLLEHCYFFPEFVKMYNKLRSASEYLDKWFERKAGKRDFGEYLRLAEQVRKRDYPVEIKFGLEVCYFKEHEELVYNIAKDKELDFLVGSVHFIDNFAYDHGENNEWKGIDVDWAYNRYFEIASDLAESGIFNGIAHPDLLKLFGHKPSFSLLNHYDKLAVALCKRKMYAEQSGGAYRRCSDTCELGINADLIKALKKHGLKIQTASDAHQPEDVGLYIKELGKLIRG